MGGSVHNGQYGVKWKPLFKRGITGNFLLILCPNNYSSDSGKWPFQTPPIHTPTKSPPIGEERRILKKAWQGTQTVLTSQHQTTSITAGKNEESRNAPDRSKIKNLYRKSTQRMCTHGVAPGPKSCSEFCASLRTKLANVVRKQA